MHVGPVAIQPDGNSQPSGAGQVPSLSAGDWSVGCRQSPGYSVLRAQNSVLAGNCRLYNLA